MTASDSVSAIAAATGGVPAAVAGNASAAVSIEELVVAKQASNDMGGTDRALAALAALKRLVD